jgi:hypothetical protein
VLPRRPEPLRLPAPLSQHSWDIAQDEFGVKGTDFIGVMGALLLQATQDQFRPYRVDSETVPDTPPAGPARPDADSSTVAPFSRTGAEDATRVSPTGSHRFDCKVFLTDALRYSKSQTS